MVMEIPGWLFSVQLSINDSLKVSSRHTYENRSRLLIKIPGVQNNPLGVYVDRNTLVYRGLSNYVFIAKCMKFGCGLVVFAS